MTPDEGGLVGDTSPAGGTSRAILVFLSSSTFLISGRLSGPFCSTIAASVPTLLSAKAATNDTAELDGII